MISIVGTWCIVFIVQDDLQETEDGQNEYNQYPFDLDRVGYKKILMAIPYMLIEKGNVCPCRVTFGRQLFYYFSAPGPIEYFKCDSKTIVFEDQTVLLKKIKTETRPKELSTINRFH